MLDAAAFDRPRTVHRRAPHACTSGRCVQPAFLASVANNNTGGAMFHQLLKPIGDSLLLSFVVAALPIATVLALLGWAKRPAWQASLAGLVVGFVIAVTGWRFPIGLALDSVFAGAVFALWPVMWIVFAAILLYNVAIRSGRFAAFRLWMIDHLPNDRRIVLVVIGFSFGALFEGISGFGTPVAITSSLLILLGFPALEALTFTLIFNTAPVAFGALGVPITVLGAVTHLPTDALAKMVGRQLPFFALLLPFYVISIYAGFRNMLRVWPVLLVAGGSFALTRSASASRRSDRSSRCCRRSSAGSRYSCPAATPPAMRCSATCRSSPRINSVWILR
jgi:lactate permease